MHPGGVTALAFSPSGKMLATGGPDRIVRLWDVSTGRELRRFVGHKDALTAVVFLRDGSRLASGSKDGGLNLWNVATGEQVRSLFHLETPLQDLAVSGDGTRLVSAGGRTIVVWEAPGGRFLRRLPLDARGAGRVAFSPDGTGLAVAGWSGAVWINDLTTGKEIRTFPRPDGGDGAMVSVAFAGKALVAADTRGKVHLFDAATGKVLRSLKGGFFSRGACSAGSPDGALLACGGDQEVSLRVYETATGRVRWERRDGPPPETAAFSPDGKLLAAAGADDAIRLWHAASGKPVHPAAGHEGPVVRVAVTADGNTVLTAGTDGTVRVWDRASGKERRRPSPGWGTLDYLAITPDGKTLAASGNHCLPCLYDLERDVKGERRSALTEFADAQQIALSPDGTRYAVLKRFAMVIHERASGRELVRHGTPFPFLVPVFSPDNRWFAATWGERDFRVLDAQTGKLVLRSSDGEAEVRRILVFSPDSKTLVSASDRRGLELWDLARKTRVRFPREKQQPCHTVAFSADGALLAWDGVDGTVCLGEVASGKERLRIRGHEGPITNVAFTKDGRFLISSSRDGTALVWDLPRLLRDGQPPPQVVAQRPPPAPRRDLYGDLLPEGGLARMGTMRWRLEGGTHVLGFTPDGKGLIVNPNGPRTGPLEILDVATGKVMARLLGAEYTGGRGSGLSVAVAGNVLAVAAAHGSRLDLWEMPAGRLLRQIKVEQGLGVVAVAPDGKTAAVAVPVHQQGKTSPILLWDLAGGRQLGSLDGHQTPIQAMTFSADGKRLLSSSPEQRWGKAGGGVDVIPGSVRIWDVATRKPLAQYGSTGYSFAFAPDGRAWAYIGQDNRLHLMTTDGGKEVAQLPMEASNAFVFSADGSTLATTAYGHPIRLWDAASGRELRRLEGQVGKGYPTLLFAPDGKTLACVIQLHWANPGGPVRLWDIPSGKEIRPAPAHQDAVVCTAASPDSKLVVSGGQDGSLFLWEARTGKSLHRLADHEGGVSAVAFSPDGKTVASGGKDGLVRLWRVADGKQLRQFDGPGGAVLSLTFSADGAGLWACGARGKLQGWEAARGGALGRFELKADSLHTSAFSPDGSLLAYVAGVPGEFSGSAIVRVCRVSSGKEIHALDLRAQMPGRDENRVVALHCWAVSFSGDGRLLATSESIQTQGLRVILGNHAIRIWEVATGRQVLQVSDLAVPTKRLALSPDGQLLAHSHGRMFGWGQGDEQVILVRDVSAAEPLHQIVREPDKQVVCLQSGATLRPLRGHTAEVSCVAFTASGKGLLTGGTDGTLVAWEAAPFVPGPKPPRARLTAEESPVLWQRLANGDAAVGYQTMARLERAPDQAVALLKKHLKPALGADPVRVARLIADLEAKSFAARQKAFNELSSYGEQAEHALRKALPGQKSLEGQRRIQQLLDRLDKVALSPEHLRALRALTVLERIGTPEARAVLEAVAAGAPTRVTQEAQASLRRRFR
jgi:WD40 repeat protein